MTHGKNTRTWSTRVIRKLYVRSHPDPLVNMTTHGDVLEARGSSKVCATNILPTIGLLTKEPMYRHKAPP